MAWGLNAVEGSPLSSRVSLVGLWMLFLRVQRLFYQIEANTADVCWRQRAWKEDLVLAALPAQLDLPVPMDARGGRASKDEWLDMDLEAREAARRKRRELNRVC